MLCQLLASGKKSDFVNEDAVRKANPDQTALAASRMRAGFLVLLQLGRKQRGPPSSWRPRALDRLVFTLPAVSVALGRSGRLGGGFSRKGSGDRSGRNGSAQGRAGLRGFLSVSSNGVGSWICQRGCWGCDKRCTARRATGADHSGNAERQHSLVSPVERPGNGRDAADHQIWSGADPLCNKVKGWPGGGTGWRSGGGRSLQRTGLWWGFPVCRELIGTGTDFALIFGANRRFGPSYWA